MSKENPVSSNPKPQMDRPLNDASAGGLIVDNADRPDMLILKRGPLTELLLSIDNPLAGEMLQSLILLGDAPALHTKTDDKMLESND